MSPTDTIQEKRRLQAEQQAQRDFIDSLNSVSRDIRVLLASLETSGAKKLDAKVVEAISSLKGITDALSSVKVESDSQVVGSLKTIAVLLKGMDTKPVVNVPQAKITVNESEPDLTPIVTQLENLNKALTKQKTTLDTKPFVEAIGKVKSAIDEIQFPIPNYVLPFLNINGDSAQVQLDASGKVPVSATIDTTGLATTATDTSTASIDTKMTANNASLASIDGKITAVNTGAVVISSSALPTGAATAANQQTDALTDTQLRATAVPVSLASVPSHAVTNAGAFAVQNTPVAPSAIYNGKKTVTTAGTRVALASSQAVKSVVIKALVENTGTIYVGDSSVASTNGFALSAGDTVSLDIANLATVYLDSSVNGEGVTYIGS